MSRRTDKLLKHLDGEVYKVFESICHCLYFNIRGLPRYYQRPAIYLYAIEILGIELSREKVELILLYKLCKRNIYKDFESQKDSIVVKEQVS